MTIFHKKENFRRIIAEIKRLPKKIYSNIPAKFESDWCSLYWVIEKTKIDNLHTQTNTHTYIFGRRLFFNVDYTYAKKKSKFDNWFLTPIQGFTQSKIEKAKLLRIELSVIDTKKTPQLKSTHLRFHRF